MAATTMTVADARTGHKRCRFFTAELEAADGGLKAAAAMLQAGEVVAFPTETVYGLGANALDAAAVAKIFRYKGRPLTSPLIVHVTAAAAAKPLLTLTPASERVFDVLAKAFWPGPLTLVAPAAACIPPTVTAGTGLVGIRVPAHPVALALLAAAGLPVAAPSANRFGHVSPTRAAHVAADLGEHPIGIVLAPGERACDAGTFDVAPTCSVGIESTVLGVSVSEEEGDGGGAPAAHLTLFRKGGVTATQLHAALEAAGIHRIHVTEHTRHDAPASYSASSVSEAGGNEGDGGGVTAVAGGAAAPGMLLTHYAPDVEAFLVASSSASSSSSVAAPAALVSRPLATAIVLDFGAQLRALQSLALAYRDLSPSGDILEARTHLFDALRWTESVPGATTVLIADPAALPGEHTAAVRDRVFRAASGKVVTLTAAEGGGVAHLQPI